ncbi:molybdopterin converting factor subunit 1 [Jeotgalibacillus sp. S-D1]|uniref:molybdopterin converting factor subunit 1 n=1 Tax=Jeotgalibacillus sp. S-D1 TaxID=2552189 RepID=UPI001059AE57|nr:molybdopterin converting factor subunit 1 [Jeotgalibacillus sp. S-D1]TDL31405.1 molybdopterin converting factor subunit 1 [Jeotgalibacillus sp. S-D1]
MINVQCFAHIREQIGKDQLILDETKITVKDLMDKLSALYSIQTESIMVAVNEEYAEPGDIVNEGDTVALIPPVSGG